MENWQSAFGFCMIAAIAWMISENRRIVAWRTVFSGILLQIVLAVALLKLPLFKHFFLLLNEVLQAVERATQSSTT